VDLDSEGAFQTRLAPRFGVHHVEVVATDGLSLEERIERDVLWAPSFDPGLASSGEPEHRLDDAIGVSLGRSFFDDGEGLERGAVPVLTRDVADILELVLYAAELDSYVPSPLLEEGMDLSLSLTGIRVRSADAEVTVEEGGFGFFIRIEEIAATSAGRLALPGETVDLAGTLSIAASASARVEVVKEGPAVALEVVIPSVIVNIESLDGRFDSPEAGALFRLAGGAIRTRVEAEIRDALTDELRAELAGIVRSTVRSLDSALADGRFSIDASPLPPVELSYDARLHSVRVGSRYGLFGQLFANTGVVATSVYPTTPGVPRISRAGIEEVLLPDMPLQVGVRVAVFNGLLHGLWAVGGLRFDATSIIPEGLDGLVDSVTVDGRMQPVLGPKPMGGEGLFLSIGQLEIAIGSGEQTDVYAANLSAGISLRVGGDEVAADVDETPQLQVWPVLLESERSLISAEVLENLIREQMWPELRRAAAQSLSQRVPLPDLDGLSDIAPSIAGTSFSFAAGERIAVRQGIVVVEGVLIGEVP